MRMIVCSAHTPKGSPLHAAGPTLVTESVTEAVVFFVDHVDLYENCSISLSRDVPDNRCTSSTTGNCRCPRCAEIDGEL